MGELSTASEYCGTGEIWVKTGADNNYYVSLTVCGKTAERYINVRCSSYPQANL